MKKNILNIVLCFLLLVITSACEHKFQDKPNNLEDTYKAINAYFSTSHADKANLSAFYVDSEKHVIIVELVENNTPNQKNFLKLTNVDEKYIEFRKDGPYEDNDIDIELSVAFDQTCGNIEFNEYLNDYNIKVYLEENVNDLYVTDAGQKMTFKDYANGLNQTLDRSIKDLTNKLEKTAALDDGGTTIYKNKDKNITIIACNTLDGNRDDYIGDYQLYYKENMCK